VTARTLQLTERLRAYVLKHGARETLVQRRLRAATQRMPRAGMQIGAEQGALLALLVRLMGARRCIEIGTFTGYSALAVALALPPRGKIVCCDLSDEWTSIARRYWRRARVARKIDLRLDTVENWQAATEQDPLFVLEVPWLKVNRSVVGVVDRTFKNFNAGAASLLCAGDLARLVFNSQQIEPREKLFHELLANVF